MMVLISTCTTAYCARDFLVELPEHGQPVLLLGHIPVGIVHEGGLGHDLLLVIAEGDGQVCLLPVKTMKMAHMCKIMESEVRMSFSQTRLATRTQQPLRKA